MLRRQFATSFVLATLVAVLVAGCATTHTSSESDAAPSGELSREELSALPEDHVLTSDDGEITVGELRRQHQSRMEALEELGRVAQSGAGEALEIVRTAHQERRITEQSDISERVYALLEHLRERDARDPEALARARALAAQRRAAYPLWVESQGPLTAGEVQRIEDDLRQIRPIVAEPVN